MGKLYDYIYENDVLSVAFSLQFVNSIIKLYRNQIIP